MCLVRADVPILVSLIYIGLFYRLKASDGELASRRQYEGKQLNFSEWWSNEDKRFMDSGVCISENRSYVETCSFPKVVEDLYALKSAQCFCDDDCHIYHDCCVNYVQEEDRGRQNWACREVRGQLAFRFPIYVFQTCPPDWTDQFTRTMCEVESSDLAAKSKLHSYLQDVPVKSKSGNVLFRNVFCALCNGKIDLVKWKSYFYCPSNLSSNIFSKDAIDFSNAVYNTRSQNFRHAKVAGKNTNCRFVVEDFDEHIILNKHGARLCKPMIDTCDPKSDTESRHKCNSYTSFVYELAYPSNKRRVYKNFHCALCNNVSVEKLICVDPLFPAVYSGEAQFVEASLTFLFDFNFEGGDNQVGLRSPCKLNEGKLWDPIKKQCITYICGSLFEREGSKCVPRLSTDYTIDGLNSSCPKIKIPNNMFILYRNKSVLINSTGVILSVNDYEILEKNGKELVSIAICVEEGSYILSFSKVQTILSEITLSLSVICLILHLFVYTVLDELRNCPGKILMSLSTCLLCAHCFLLIESYIRNTYWICYACAVLMHFGYLSSFLWMNVMAYDIYRTFSETKSRSSMTKRTFFKYSLYCWITSSSVIIFSVSFDNIVQSDNTFRPKYGNPICWFNQRKGVLIFFMVPIFTLLLKNVILFSISAFRINKISEQTKMVGNFTDKVRYFLYIKLSVVFGLTWILGLLAGSLQADFLWYPFILFNGLQGVFIFIAFTIKRKIIKSLLIKFKIRSDASKIGQETGLKRTMYSSLSNLSTLQTTLTAHLPALSENTQVLNKVRTKNHGL